MIRSASGLISALLRSLGSSSSPPTDHRRKLQRSLDSGPSCAPADDGVKTQRRGGDEATAGLGSEQPPAHPCWNFGCGSEAALRSTNPIRKVVDALGDAEFPDDKVLITLAIGDPTAYDGVKAPSVATEALIKAVGTGAHNGYAASTGLTECRAAVASYHNAQLPASFPPLSPADVVMTSGASQALQLAIAAVSNPGCNILLPQPGFPLYQTLCEYYGVEFRFYSLLPERGWEADIAHIRSLADSRTAAIVICNPSNPCGSVFAEAHLQELLAAAAALKLVVISDEAALSVDTPLLTVGALSKRWIVPGWRVGWLLVHDRHGCLAQARVSEALSRLAQISIGPTVPVQAAVPALLFDTPKAWYDGCLRAYRAAADLCLRRAASCPGVFADDPVAGAMYLLLRVDVSGFSAALGVTDDVGFAAALQREEALVVLPGAAFRAPGRVRLVLCAPLDLLSEAWDRLERFCRRHHALAPGGGAGVAADAPAGAGAARAEGQGGEAVGAAGSATANGHANGYGGRGAGEPASSSSSAYEGAAANSGGRGCGDDARAQPSANGAGACGGKAGEHRPSTAEASGVQANAAANGNGHHCGYENGGGAVKRSNGEGKEGAAAGKKAGQKGGKKQGGVIGAAVEAAASPVAAA